MIGSLEKPDLTNLGNREFSQIALVLMQQPGEMSSFHDWLLWNEVWRTALLAALHFDLHNLCRDASIPSVLFSSKHYPNGR